MRVLVAPNSFKGSATSIEIADYLIENLKLCLQKVGPRDITFTNHPIADGGDGSLEVMKQLGFEACQTFVNGPLGGLVKAEFGIRGETAFIEIAEACGMKKLNGKKRDSLAASTFGAGELIRAALDKGVRKLILGIGGTATTDAGSGALSALGVRLLDAKENVLPLGGGNLINLARIDLAGLDSRLGEVEIVIACDVENSILGDFGSARVFAPQKGANDSEISLLEASLEKFVEIAGSEFAESPGSGAAGGFGYAALTFLGASLVSGVDLILSESNFYSGMKRADVVITGEGKFDLQSIHGKAPYRVLGIGKELGKPVLLVTGSLAMSRAEMKNLGFYETFALTDYVPIDEAISNPKVALEKMTQDLISTLNTL